METDWKEVVGICLLLPFSHPMRMYPSSMGGGVLASFPHTSNNVVDSMLLSSIREY